MSRQAKNSFLSKMSKAFSKSKLEPNDATGGKPALKRRRRGKRVEEIYQKVTPVEHILLRPDTYVGSVEKQDENLWIWSSAENKMQKRSISYVPGLYKIFDEILVNAADNLQRPNADAAEIWVEIDVKQKRIKVWNNGRGIPIQIHKKHKVYVPELVFGHLLTSDKYDDSEKKVTGGRNGFGAKLTNVFSRRFIIETAGKGKTYSQQWLNNMGRKGSPAIDDGYSGTDYTSVEFWPDLEKFGMDVLEEETVSLMRKRVYDLAGTSGERCSVFLDGEKLPATKFEDYCRYFHSGDDQAYVRVGKRWEVLVVRSGSDGFEQFSFVNAISTPKGGMHVQYIVDQLVDTISAKACKQVGKGIDIRRDMIKNNLRVFINCFIENPAFSSQTKEQMTLKVASFGSTCELPRAFMDEVLEKTDVINVVVSALEMKMICQLDKHAKTGSAKRALGIPKLEDANDAGGKFGSQCTLILTEGDSAKALAIAGLSVIGRDRYGVFPLRGKLLNVRDATQKQIAENKEIMSIVRVLGLSFGSKVERSRLRYGSVMIMADQDHDGSHIKGLLINFFHCWWPNLLQEGGFVKEFVTPIVKATKGGELKQFFTQAEYEVWKEGSNGAPGWSIKYYKGLGTSTSAEAKQYFGAMARHSLEFSWTSTKDDELIDMAFNKWRADDRKAWINRYEEGTHVDHSQASLTYKDFINLELVQFSKHSTMRAVPSMMDGLKPTQRKVLFCSFKRNLRSDVKVAQLVGYVCEHSAYHHGEASLGNTIVSMAQDFVGSNNINLLIPSGQFGTRAQGGNDAASTRYIYTRLSPLTRLIFHPHDDEVLMYMEEDGQRIEPHWYVPVIPMALVNGAMGIGTGWSTDVPNYDPRQIIGNLRCFIRKEKMRPMKPWFRGFTGKIRHSAKGMYTTTGVWKEKGAGNVIKAAIECETMLTPTEVARAEREVMREARELKLGKNVQYLIELPEFKYMVDGKRRAFEVLKAAEGDVGTAKAALLESLDDSEKADARRRGSSDDTHVIEILELPVRKWTQDYKEFLMGMLPDSDKKTSISLQHIREHHTENKVHFEVRLTDRELPAIKEQGMEDIFKLANTITETNMVLFDSNSRIKKYESPLEILEEFGKVRLHYYSLRKKYLVDKLTLEHDLVANRARFILLIIQGKLTLGNRRKADVVTDLTLLEFQRCGDERSPRTGFEYLLIMQLSSLTKERKEELERVAAEKAKELELVRQTSIQDMWLNDLGALETAINDLYSQTSEEVADRGTKRKRAGGATADGQGKRRGLAGRGRDTDEGDEGDKCDANSQEEEDSDAFADPLRDPFADIDRWTSGRLKNP